MTLTESESAQEEGHRNLIAFICTAPRPGFWRDSDPETPLQLRRNLIIDDVLGFRETVQRSINEFQGPSGLSKCLMVNMFFVQWSSRSGAIKGLLSVALTDGGKDGISHKAGDVCITVHPEYTRKGLATMMLDEVLKCLPVNLERQRYSATGAKFIAGYLSRKAIRFNLEYETPEEYCDRATIHDAADRAVTAATYAWLKRSPGPHTQREAVTAVTALMKRRA